MLKTILSAAAAAAVTASAASATTYATDIVWSGTNIPGSARSDVQNALGAPDEKFLSLGLGGTADFSFGGFIAEPASIVEVTWGWRPNHAEKADIFVGNAGDEGSFTFVATIDNDTDDAVAFSFAGVFNTLRVVDTSEPIIGRDGFDVDAVAVTVVPDPTTTPIPLPATALLLGAGLGALGVARKIKR